MGRFDGPPSKPKPKRFEESKTDHEKIQNKRLDKSLGGRTTKASGATSRYKGDRDLGEDFKVEQKATKTNTQAVPYRFLEKIHKEARDTDRQPALAVSFLKAKGYVPKDWIMVPVDIFKKMFDCCKENGLEF